MKIDSNNHSVFSMYYHLVLVVKYRRKVIDNTISDYAKEKFVSLGEKYNITLVEWNHDRATFIFCSRLIQIQSYQNLLMRIKAQVQDSLKKTFLLFVKDYGRKCFGQEVFAY
jgi:Transposase IS200 like